LGPAKSAKAVVRRYLVFFFLGLLALSLAAYGGACWYLWNKQRELIFFPTREVTRTPADVSVTYEDVRLPIGGKDPAFLHGWWLQSADADAAVVLYLHGNDLNLGSNVDHIAALYRLGFSILAVDYRGYGKSEGAFPSESQVYEDAEAAWDYLVRARNIDPRRAFVYGHSLGGAVAIELALRRPEAAGVIAESAFTSIADMARIGYWMFPVDWLLNQRFDALAKSAKLRMPVLFIHGTADTEVPYTMSERLFAAAPEPKSLTLIPRAGHENCASVGGALYSRAVLEFAQKNRRGPLRRTFIKSRRAALYSGMPALQARNEVRAEPFDPHWIIGGV
jgi:pimeloyl-ACP methyl ester carboxylesterase